MEFLEREARKRNPAFKRRSGLRYRFNRWREEQLVAGVPLTYGDLVTGYLRLNEVPGPFKKVPVGRYINFLADFLETEKGGTHARARIAWKEIKSLDVPKTYAAWKRFQPKPSR